MGPRTGGMMEGLLVSNSPFLGDFLDPPLPWRRHTKELNFGNVSETCRSIICNMFCETKMV